MTDTPPNDTTSDATAPAAKSVGKKAGGLRKAADKSARTRAREFGVQALYQYLVGQNTLESIDTFTRDLTGFHKADSLHFDTLLTGCIEDREALEAMISPHLDRPIAEVSPIEHAVLLIGAKELENSAFALAEDGARTVAAVERTRRNVRSDGPAANREAAPFWGGGGGRRA